MPADLVALAERARAAGRLGIDTEFMPEGRYKPLLCLVQVVVGDEVVVLDPLDGHGRPGTARRPASPIRRSRSCCTPAARTWPSCGGSGTPRSPTSSTRRSPRASPATPPRPATPACCTTCSRSGSPSRPPSPAGTRGRSPRSSSATRARTSSTCRALADALQARLRRARAARLGARGVPRDRRRDGRARPRGDVAPAAADLRARRARAGGRARARRLAGADGRGRGPPRRRAWCATRRWSSWPSASRAARRSSAPSAAPGPDVLRRRARDILAAIERGRAAPPVRLEEGERLGTEPVDGPAIALAEALVRARAQEAGLAYELIAARADLAPIVVAARRGRPEPETPHARRLAARARRRRAARAAGRAALAGRRGRRAGHRPLRRRSREPCAIGVGLRRAIAHGSGRSPAGTAHRARPGQRRAGPRARRPAGEPRLGAGRRAPRRPA